MEATEPKTLEQAAESLLMPETPVTESEETEEVETEEEPDADQTDEVEAEAEEADAEDDSEEVDPQDEEDEDEDADQDGPETITVKVDGEEVEVTLDDLKRSYSGQKYIQKGMQEAAQARKQAEEAFNALQSERERLANFVQQVQQTGLQAPKPPSSELFDTDPIGYMEQKIRYDEQKAQYDRKVQEFQQLSEGQRRAEMQARQAYLQEQSKLLAEYIPDIADPDKGGKVKESILHTAKDVYGFSDQELAAIVDARHVRVLNDARRWQELQASKKQATESVKKKARPMVKAASKAKVDPKRAAREKARQRLKQTGSVHDAISLIMDN